MTLGDDVIRRAIAAIAQGEMLCESTARASHDGMPAAQGAGATGEAKVAILVAFHNEWKAMVAAVDEIRGPQALQYSSTGRGLSFGVGQWPSA